MEFKDKEGFEKGVKAQNGDAYGLACFDYAERWANLMESKIKDGNTVAEIADSTSREADTDGITGFMYGVSVSILSHCWVHGEELRKWHNKEWGHDGDGVVNPAILTIN